MRTGGKREGEAVEAVTSEGGRRSWSVQGSANAKRNPALFALAPPRSSCSLPRPDRGSICSSGSQGLSEGLLCPLGSLWCAVVPTSDSPTKGPRRLQPLPPALAGLPCSAELTVKSSAPFLSAISKSDRRCSCLRRLRLPPRPHVANFAPCSDLTDATHSQQRCRRVQRQHRWSRLLSGWETDRIPPARPQIVSASFFCECQPAPAAPNCSNSC